MARVSALDGAECKQGERLIGLGLEELVRRFRKVIVMGRHNSRDLCEVSEEQDRFALEELISGALISLGGNAAKSRVKGFEEGPGDHCYFIDNNDAALRDCEAARVSKVEGTAGLA